MNGNSMVCLGVLMGKDSKPSAESNYCKVSVMIRHQLDRILRCLESKEVWSSYKALVTLLTCWKPKFVPIYSNIHANIHSNIHSVIFQYSFRYIPIFIPIFQYISSNFHSNIAGIAGHPTSLPIPGGRVRCGGPMPCPLSSTRFAIQDARRIPNLWYYPRHRNG